MSTSGPQGVAGDVDGWPLLERDADLGTLTEAVAGAREGRGGFLLVRAPAGVGKTRLLDTAVDLGSKAEMTVVRAAGSVLERDFPFGVTLRLLERRLREAPEAERERLLAGSAAPAASVLLGGEPVEHAVAAASDASLLHALGWVVMNLATERPLVLVVDDLHWADAVSIRLLIGLAAQVDDLPLLIVAATRPREPGAEAGLLAQLTAASSVRLLEPRALSVAASEVLVRGSGERSGAFVRACFEQTGGNPLLLRELLRALASEEADGADVGVERVEAIGPEAIEHRVEATLAQLGPDPTALATAIAVLADDTDLHSAAVLAGLEPRAAANAAAALQDAGLLGDEAALRFRHPLLRRAVYERPAPAARAALHREAARTLLGRVAPHDVASHLVLTPGAGEPWAVEVLRAAAREATALAGHGAAARLLRRALAEPPASAELPAVLGEVALAAVRAGDGEAVPAVRAAIAVASSAEDRARLWLALSRTHYQRGEMTDAAQSADHGLAAIDDETGLESLALELRAAWNASTVWTAGGSAAVAERFGDVVEGDGPGRNQGERELLAWLAGSELFRGVDRERALSLARRAWADGAYLLDGTGDAARMGPMTTTIMRAGEIEEAILVLDALVDDARRHASPFAHATWLTTRGTGFLYLGRLAEAEADLVHALRARALGWEATAPMAVESLVRVYLEQDRLDAAAALLETTAPLEHTHAEGAMLASLLTARGRHAFASGDARAARDHLLAAGVRVREFLGTDNPAIIPWRSEVALAARQLGDLEEATVYATEELDAARRWGAPCTLARALWTQAVVVGGPAGAEYAAEAVLVAREGGVVLEEARALQVQGALLRAGRQRSASQALFRRALDLAAERGAHALVRQLREELVAAGGRPRRTRTQGPGALTAGERRVALLAAEGLTNRQIADTLFVTPKAVGFHLGNAYRKLSIQGREQLADALRGT